MSMFSGPEEEGQALAWMRNRLIDAKSGMKNKNTEQRNTLVDLISEIKSRESQLIANSIEPEDDFHDRLWDRFIFAIDNQWIEEAKENWKPSFQQGEWAFVNSQKLEIGYSKNLEYTYVPRGGGSAKHYYNKIPPSITWELTPIKQKNKVFFIGKAKVSEIDAVCSVPQLPAEMSSAETAKRVLNPQRGENQWQRRVDPKRVESIRRFIQSDDNLVANSAILYAPPHEAIKSDKEGKIKIKFDKFLDNNGGLWSDFKGKNDLRPVWLIDGQHRTRGLSQSDIGAELDIPIIVFPSDFNLSQSAKIFSEINTLQVKLSALHTLYMQHRFGISSPTAKRDFTRPWEDINGEINNNSRANHMAYECAAYLAQNKGGPLYDKIKILDSNNSRSTIIQASQWVDFSRQWFREGGIYGPLAPENKTIINEEVENYFQAFIETSNHGKWSDNNDRWSFKGNKKGLIQRHGPSQALLKIYQNVWQKARLENPSETPISIKTFKKVLKPLMWIDWISPELKKHFGGGGERPRTALREWLKCAIENGKCYSEKEVMSREIKSKPGRGILAPSGGGRIIVDGNTWPYPGRPVKIVAHQPYNSLPTSTWQILDSNGFDRTEELIGTQSIVARNRIAELTIRSSNWIKNTNYLDLRVQWMNTVNPPGHATHRLKKT